MQQRRLGPSGPAVPAMGLGCMGMSDFYGPRDEAESLAVIARALDLGAGFLDTADVYGPHTNEALVGKAIRGRRREAFVATKFGLVREGNGPISGVNGRPDHVRACCDASLARLGVDAIDLYYLHRVDPGVPIEETVGAMADLVGAGKARYLGLSEVSAATLRRACAVHPISALQSEYSLWTRDPETTGTLAACRELGVGFVAYSPLGRGFLTGAIRAPEDLAEDDNRRRHPRFAAANFARNLALADHVRELARRKGCTPAQLALAWLLARDPHLVPIPGTRRRPRLDENLGAIEVGLDAAELAAIDAAFPPDAAVGTRYPEGMMKFVNS